MPKDKVNAAVLQDSMGVEGTQTFHKMLTNESTSAFQRYCNIVLGRRGFLPLAKYEMVTSVIGPLPGALGLLLRKIFFPRILGQVGHNVIFGKNITLRHGHKIRLGNRVVIDDNVVLDAKGGDNKGIEIGDDTIISRNCVLSCKNGNIRIGRSVSLGIMSLIHAVTCSDVTIGDKTIMAAYTYLIGGGNYHFHRLDIPIKDQGTYSKGGVSIGENVWIGSHVQVLDGVSVGGGSILSAGAVVNRDVPEFSIVGGVPAKSIRSRLDSIKHSPGLK